MYMKIIVFTLLTFAAVTFTVEFDDFPVYWRNCGSPLATIHNVRMSNCQHTPCRITRGIHYHIEVDATAHTWASLLPFNVTAQVLAFPVLVTEGDICDFLIVGECPVYAGDKLIFRELIHIPTGLPTINTTAISRVWTQDYELAICVEIPVELV